MEVVRLNSNVPIKAIPEGELNRILIQEFAVWVSSLLSLTDQKSADRLKTALPAVKQHCWSMGFSEIKKMFEMYADNRLSVEPKSNYFDRVLFGQIVEAYKQQKQPVKKTYETTELSEQEKADLVYAGVINCYDAWVQEKRIVPGYTWVYDHLDELRLLNYSPEEKKQAMKDAEIMLKEGRSLLTKIEEKSQERSIVAAKRILLATFFENTDKETLKSKL